MALAATQETVTRRVRRTLDDAGASLIGRRVLAMCSGGADSVALVALLGALPRGAAPASVDVLWIDHDVRDDTAEELAAARAAAESIAAPLHVRVATGLDVRSGSSGEGPFRAFRYEVALDLAAELGCDVVCTGHSATDQVEQALLSLLGITGRGGTVDALPVVRELAPAGPRLVRPLLSLTREQLEQACADAGLAWGTDPSNEDADHTPRNAIRHRVVPALLEVSADAGVAIARAGRRQRDRDAAVRTLAEQLLQSWAPHPDDRLELRRLAALDAAPRRELIAAWLRRAGLGRGVTERAVLAVDHLALLPGRAACAAVDLGRSTCIRRDGYHLAITTAPDTEGPIP